MRIVLSLTAALLLWPLALGAGTTAELKVTPDGLSLVEAVRTVTEGGTVRVTPGEYHVNLNIDRPLTLVGEPGAVLDGGGAGSIVRVTAPDVTIRGFTIRNSGFDLTRQDAGISLERGAHRARVEDNRLENVAFGIWAWHLEDLRITNNEIAGNVEVRSQDRGDGIRLFAIERGLIENNRIRDARDAIYVETSRALTIRGNRFDDLRYGVHYMYAHDGRIIGNTSRNTRSGYALMSSRNLEVVGNRSEDDRGYGILLNFVTYSTITGNTVRGVRGASAGGAEADGHGVVIGGEGKALFVYNSLYNEIRGNRIEASEIGIHLTAGAEQNRIFGNAFINNRIHVKYVANLEQDWAVEGIGNFWSNYLGWDIDGDGIGDVAFEPNDGIDRLLWKYPMARMLLNSPAVATLRWVQHQFPVLRPPGVRDSAPLMRPPVMEPAS